MPERATDVKRPNREAARKRRVQIELERWLAPEGLEMIRAYARDGLSLTDIARKMGVSKTTLYKWKGEHAEILDALKKGKEFADVTVENALFQSAVGRIVTLRKPIRLRTVKVRDGSRIETEEIQYVDEEVYIPGNVTAQIFYLKNRVPEKWRSHPADSAALTAVGPLVTIINDIPDVPQEAGKQEGE